jgi:hypothetical protein
MRTGVKVFVSHPVAYKTITAAAETVPIKIVAFRYLMISYKWQLTRL